MPIALERVDVLDAQVRDIGDDVGQMQKQIGKLEEEKTTILTKELPQLQASVQGLVREQEVRRELAYVHLELTTTATESQTLLWRIDAGGSPHLSLHPDNETLEFAVSGLLAITAHFQHNSSKQGTCFELQVNTEVVRSVSSFNTSGHGHTSSFTMVRGFTKGDKLSVVYRGNTSVYGRSSMTIVELRRD